VGILDENEDVISTTECVHAFVAGEARIFLFQVADIGSPEPELLFSMTAETKGKKRKGKVKKHKKKKDEGKKLNLTISGVRKWNEEKLEAKYHKRIKKLKPKWQKHFNKLLGKMKKRGEKKAAERIKKRKKFMKSTVKGLCFN